MKFGVREICDVVLKAKSNVKLGSHIFTAGEPVIYFDTAKTSSLESQATTVYAQGGGGNSRLIAWEGEKTLTFTMEDALISPKGIAILTGADLITPTTTAPITAHTTEVINVTTAGQVTLSNSPVTTADCYLMLLDNNGEMSGVPIKVAASAISTATITDARLEVGDQVMVDYYTSYTADAVQMDITPEQFAGYYYLEASTLFRREADGKDLPAEFIIPKVKIQSNFTFSMASTGDPSTFTFTMDAFPDYTKFDKTKKVLACIQVLKADDNFDLVATENMGTLSYERWQEYTDNDYISRQSTVDAYDDAPNPLKTTDTKIYPTG